MFIVKKTFLSGALEGLTITDTYCPLSFEVGGVYGGASTGPLYRVDSCRKGTPAEIAELRAAARAESIALGYSE